MAEPREVILLIKIREVLMKLTQLSLPLTGLALISLASPSYADRDYKVHPGSQCQPSDGLEVGNFLRGPGFIYNTNPNQRLLVTCPVLRDRIGPGATLFAVTLDGTAGQSIECRLFILNVFGAEVYSASQFTNPNLNTNSLQWEITAEQSGGTSGTYSINCELPVNVFLLQYRIWELENTDGNQ
jgi:hypothetical protein